jgi:hypothetical protein
MTSIKVERQQVEPTYDKRKITEYVNNIYANKGDWITCEWGHKIARFQEDVQRGTLFNPAAIAEWTQPEPMVGDVPPKCAQCGCNFYMGMTFHFRDGWRV